MDKDYTLSLSYILDQLLERLVLFCDINNLMLTIYGKTKTRERENLKIHNINKMVEDGISLSYLEIYIHG